MMLQGTFRVSRLLSLTKIPNPLRTTASTPSGLSGQLKQYLDNMASEVDALKDLHTLEPTQRRQVALYKKVGPKHEQLSTLVTEVEELTRMRDEEIDKELKEAAKTDLEAAKEGLVSITEELSGLLLPSEAFDENDAVLEVTAGAGGLEAALFAQEIFDMYINYSSSQLGFEVSILATELAPLQAMTSSKGKAAHGTGLKRGEAKISGRDVFKALKLECGVHRVQRVPITGSKADRLQTSTCAVAVLPLPTVAELSLPKSDLRVEFMRSSGPGGQAVNTSDTCVRIVHLPSNTVVECQETRSQTKNYELALDRLRRVLYERVFNERMRSIASSRRSQIGSMNRNEKVRSYNFSRNTITDHRSGTVKQIASLRSLFKDGVALNTVREMSESLQKQIDQQRLTAILEEALSPKSSERKIQSKNLK